MIACKANAIYAYITKECITKFTIINTKCQIVDDLVETGQEMQGILINNDFHIIGAEGEHYKRSKWLKTNQAFEALHDLGEETNMYGIKDFGLIKVKDKPLLFRATLPFLDEIMKLRFSRENS